MYGKIFASVFTGSMFGSGPAVFAVWAYAIACADSQGFVELNSKLLAVVIGCEEKQVTSAIEFLCAPDPDSRSKAEDGRRMIQEGRFLFRIVNYAEYRSLRDADERREYQRKYRRDYRAAGRDQSRGGQQRSTTDNQGQPGSSQAEVEAEVEVKKKSRGTPNGSRFALTLLPKDWKDACKAIRKDLDPDVTFERFKDYWTAQPGAKGRKTDWLATWRNWCRNEKAANGNRPDPVKPWHQTASGVTAKGVELGLTQEQFDGDWHAFKTAVYERAGVA